MVYTKLLPVLEHKKALGFEITPGLRIIGVFFFLIFLSWQTHFPLTLDKKTFTLSSKTHISQTAENNDKSSGMFMLSN